MPVMTGKDKDGCYARWGKQGKKYKYTCGDNRSKAMAVAKAFEQGKAIIVNKGEKSA